ncbi:MAG: glycosyltransferase 87 family protein [Vulcanimicrobiaceae bacterium]
MFRTRALFFAAALAAVVFLCSGTPAVARGTAGFVGSQVDVLALSCLALFRPFGVLPFGAANLLGLGGLVLAAVGTIAWLRRLSALAALRGRNACLARRPRVAAALGTLVMKPFALAALTTLLVVMLASFGPRLLERGVPGPVTNPADFRAFYCGSRVLSERADPYRTEPLRTCEHAAAAAYGLRVFDGLVLPAPLPPFALLELTPFALLPFTLASPAWFMLCVLAVAATVGIVRKLSGAPLWSIALAFVLADAYQSLPNGQVVPLIVLATCASALALRARRYRTAALLALATLAEPHLGLPVVLSLFLWMPRTRGVLALGAVALAAVSVAWAGAPLVHQYVSDVLPLHAHSEVGQLVVQYSLTTLAHTLGLSERAALTAGSVSYAAMLVLGVWLARRLARAWGDEAPIVLAPAAFVLLGGVFIHLHQMAAALPLAFVLVGRTRGSSRMLAVAAVLALALPWEGFAQLPALQARFAAGSASASLAPRAVPPAPAGVLAETAETAFIAGGGYGRDPRTDAELIAFKLPTWLGLLFLISATASAACRTRGDTNEPATPRKGDVPLGLAPDLPARLTRRYPS